MDMVLYPLAEAILLCPNSNTFEFQRSKYTMYDIVLFCLWLQSIKVFGKRASVRKLGTLWRVINKQHGKVDMKRTFSRAACVIPLMFGPVQGID